MLKWLREAWRRWLGPRRTNRLEAYVQPVEEKPPSSTGSWHSLEVSCHPVATLRDDPWPAQVQDITTDHIGLLLKRRFEPNTLLTVELQSPALDYQRTLLARVVQAKAHGGAWLIGCLLANKLDHDEVEALKL